MSRLKCHALHPESSIYHSQDFQMLISGRWMMSMVSLWSFLFLSEGLATQSPNFFRNELVNFWSSSSLGISSFLWGLWFTSRILSDLDVRSLREVVFYVCRVWADGGWWIEIGIWVWVVMECGYALSTTTSQRRSVYISKTYCEIYICKYNINAR